MISWIEKHASKLIALMLLCIVGYGLSRLYFELTGGFTESNIVSSLSYDSRFETKDTKQEVDEILSKEYDYLGKGCQSYVFLSRDGQYVLKFLKYQRFRPQAFLDYLTFIPAIDRYRSKKIIKKKEKLDKLFTSWKIAFDHLEKETGLVYLHLNKTAHLQKPLVIYDKLGIKHVLNADNLEFLVQKRADMLCQAITKCMKSQKVDEAKALLTQLIETIVSEYERGLADNDHALMQNTGVIDGQPIHIDVGQFVSDDMMKLPENYHPELFSKTYKFRIWLSKHYPELEGFVTDKLLNIIGPKMFTMKPKLKTIDEGA